MISFFIEFYLVNYCIYLDRCLMQPIDFVMIWVDSTDTKWQQQYIYYKSKETKTKIDELVDQCRYRDWNNLHY